MLKQIFKQLSDSRAHANNLNNYIRTNKIIRNAGMSASFLLFVFALLASFPIVPHTDIVEAASPLESETEIEMSIGKGSANLSLTPKDMSGTFASSSSSDLAEFNVTTNNYTGYTLGIKATDDTKQLTNVDIPTAKLDSITSVIDSSTFNTQDYNGKWGYKPSKYNSVDNVAFHPAPTTDGSTLDVTSSANPNPDSNHTYTIGLGARVDHTKPTGVYSNTFILTAVGNPVAYTLNYLDNTGDTSVSNMPATNSGTTAATKVQIASNIPTRTGFTFAGWCDEEPTLNTDGSTTCGGSVYQASTTETPVYYSFINQTLQNSIGNVYAMWNIASYLQTVQVRYQNANGTWGDYTTYAACTKDVIYGQTHSCSIAATEEYQAATLSSYTVTSENTKQIDVYRNTFTITVSNSNTTSGKSSFTVLYGGSNTVTVTPSSGYYLSSVSCPSGYSCTGYNTGTSYTGQQTVTVTHTTATANGTLGFSGTPSCAAVSGTMQAFSPTSSMCASGTLSDSRDNQNYTVAKIGSLWWMTKNLNLAGGITITSSDSNVSWSYTLPTSSPEGFKEPTTDRVYNSGSTSCGYNSPSPCYSYYNYVTATAGTNPSSGNASSDICPKGWRLPTAAEFNTLINTYTTSSAITGSPFYGVYAGNYNSGFYGDRIAGLYWSSTVLESVSSIGRIMIMNKGEAPALGAAGKWEGCSVRCVKVS